MKTPISPPVELTMLDRAQFRRSMARLDIDGLVDLSDLIERFGVLAALEQDAECEDEATQRGLIIHDELRRRGFYGTAVAS